MVERSVDFATCNTCEGRACAVDGAASSAATTPREVRLQMRAHAARDRDCDVLLFVLTAILMLYRQDSVGSLIVVFR